MSDLFALSADFYAQFPSPIVRDAEGTQLESEVREIVKNSSFLEESERENMPRLLAFFGTDALAHLRDSLIRQNLRTLITASA